MIIPKKDAKGRYYVRFWRKDGSRPYKLLEKTPGLSYQQAKGLAVAFYNTFEDGKPSEERPTLTECFSTYLNADSNISEGNAARIRMYLERKFIPFFGDKAVEDLTVLDVEKYKTFRLTQDGYGGTKAKGGTINREVATLLSVISRCFQLGIIKTHPLAGKKINRFEKASKKGNFFDYDEWKAFIAAFSGREALLEGIKRNARIVNSPHEREAYIGNARRMADLFLTQLLTCSRIGEIIDLSFTAMNFKTGRLSIYQPKTGATKYQDMMPELLAIFQRLYKASPDKGGYVFTRADGKQFPINQVESFFAAGLKLAGVTKPFTPHTIRHTSCSWMAIAGVSLLKIQEIAGHKDYKSTLEYAYLSPSSLRDGLSVLSGKSDSLPIVDNASIQKMG